METLNRHADAAHRHLAVGSASVDAGLKGTALRFTGKTAGRTAAVQPGARTDAMQGIIMAGLSRRPRTILAALVYVILTCLRPAGCFSQMENPVYVDDSPLAWEMFQRAQDQARDNVTEAVRLYQELLDQYSEKLIPVAPGERDRMYAVRTRVLDSIRADNELLARYQLIEQAAAERLLAGNELELLVETRSLTLAGLEALLRMGQRELEAARFRAALRMLNEAAAHPDLDEQRAAHCAYMTALAAHYLDESALRSHARDQLQALSRVAEPFLAELDRLTEQPMSNGPVVGISPFDRSVEFALDDLVPQEIWSKELSETIVRRRFSNAAANSGTGFIRERRRRDMDLVTFAATATDHAVYVNEGHTVRAFDRFTGYEIWPAPFRDRMPVAIQNTPELEVGDLNLIAVEGDALVTLTGHAGADGRTNSGLIVCIDARTGEKRWTADVDRMLGEDEYEGLFPYGAPIIAEGRVFCLARKQSTQTLTATYLVALDLNDGTPVWVRHVASSALIRMHNTRPFSLPVYDGGEIIVATAVGAVACIDASSGHFKWLRVHRPPIMEPALLRQPWEISGPALTPRGIVTIQPDESRVMLLDRTTGQMLESYPIGTLDGWGAPRYLLANDRYLFAVGATVRAFSVDELERPLWQIPSVPQTSAVDGADARSARDELDLAGRVQLTESALIVPTTNGLHLVDVETGREAQRIPLRSNAVPLAMDSQLFVAGADYLDAYMPFGTAERILRERLARAPDDLEPALSLLRLGIRVRHLDLALEAAETARRILSSRTESVSAEAGRDTLFAMLLEAARLGLGSGAEAGERLHAMLRAVAVTPEQQVEQLLAYGAWATERGSSANGGREPQRLHEAVEAYQTILDHALLATTERQADGVSKSARQWAIDRLDGMIATHGRPVYAPQEDYARLELEQLLAGAAGPGADVTALRGLAARFPFAEAAGEAALRAAQLLADADLQREAMALLATVQMRVPAGLQPASLRLLGEMVRLSESMGWRDHAAALLRHAASAYPGKPLVLGEGSRDPKVWLELLGAQAEAPPSIGPQRGPAEAIAGALISGQRKWIESDDDRLLFVVHGETLHALRAPNLSEAWKSTIGAATWELLGVHDGALILWQRSPIQDPRAVAVDVKDGTVRWTTPSLERVERNAVDQIRRDRGGIELMPNGQPLNVAEVLPALTDEKLLLVRRTGEMYAVDLRHGEPLLTLARQTLAEVHEVLVTDLGVVLIGRGVPMGGRGAAGMKAPAIVQVSEDTGEIMLRIEPTGASGVLWSALTDVDELVFGTEAGIELVNLHTGERRWRQLATPVLASRHGWIADDRVLVEDSLGALRSLALQTGAMSEPFNRPRSALGGDSSPLRDVVVSRGRIFAQFYDRIVRVSKDGVELGADAITGDREYRWLLPASDRLVLVSRVGTQQVQEQATSRTKHFYHIYSLSENGAIMQEGSDLEPLDDSIREATLVDGWLILSTGPNTLAVPMPVGE
jgi:outer membrane protein assembly factor BamB